MLLIFRYAVKQKTFVRLYMFYITVDRFSKLVNRCQQYLSLICKHFWLQNKHFHETKAPSLLETIFLKSKKKKTNQITTQITIKMLINLCNPSQIIIIKSLILTESHLRWLRFLLLTLVITNTRGQTGETLELSIRATNEPGPPWIHLSMKKQSAYQLLPLLQPF